MKKYVMVLVNGNSHKIGKHEYTREQADIRLKELEAVGITNMVIMSKNKAYGIEK